MKLEAVLKNPACPGEVVQRDRRRIVWDSDWRWFYGRRFLCGPFM